MKQITGNIFQIGLGAVNVFVVEDKGLTLIDTGLKGSTERIFTALRMSGKDPADIRRILLTHAHPDHAGSAAEIKRRLGIPVLAHKEDAQLVEQGIAGRQPMQLTPGLMNRLLFHLFIKHTGNTIEPVSIEETLADGDLLPIAGGIQVIHTPGHSAGHIALLVRNEGLLIAGDICANAAGLGLSTLYEDRELGLKSILKATDLDFDKAVFGHGKVLRKGAAGKLKKKFSFYHLLSAG
jgi:glyoxylase-like metal-dependent hydrolase (beta-lactamase superfamily II)